VERAEIHTQLRHSERSEESPGFNHDGLSLATREILRRRPRNMYLQCNAIEAAPQDDVNVWNALRSTPRLRHSERSEESPGFNPDGLSLATREILRRRPRNMYLQCNAIGAAPQDDVNVWNALRSTPDYVIQINKIAAGRPNPPAGAPNVFPVS